MRRTSARPTISNRKTPICFSLLLYRDGNHVVRFCNWIKHCRGIATRYDKLAANHPAVVRPAAIRANRFRLENVVECGIASDFSFANKVLPAIKHLPAARKLKWNTWGIKLGQLNELDRKPTLRFHYLLKSWHTHSKGVQPGRSTVLPRSNLNSYPPDACLPVSSSQTGRTVASSNRNTSAQ